MVEKGKTEKIRALIIDDEPWAREGLRIQLEEDPDIEIIGECSNGKDAVATIKKQSPDLVFLDIQMPDLDGFGVVEKIGAERMPVVIFVTAYDEYALRAFEAHALDYLLKPIDEDRLFLALKRAKAQITLKSGSESGEQVAALLLEWKAEKQGNEHAEKYLKRVAVKTTNERIFFLEVKDIDWIETQDNYIRIYARGESYLLRETMSGIARKLDPANFLRIRRSTLVSIDNIKELQPLFNGEYIVILQNGKQLQSSRRFRQNLETLLRP